MAANFPAGIGPGSIVLHTRFYIEPSTGELKPKYLLVLAPSSDGDVVFRLLTSQSTGRREVPPCFHGDPYPAYFLGVPGPPLGKKTWVDLRRQQDFEGRDFASALGSAVLIVQPNRIARPLLCEILSCVAGADDTTNAQEQALRTQRSALNC